MAGISGNGCSEASSGKSICANIGMSVTIMCNVSPGDSYIITGAGRSSFNKPLMFTVTDDSYGDYTCMSANPCASTTDTNHLERAVCKLLLKTNMQAYENVVGYFCGFVVVGCTMKLKPTKSSIQGYVTCRP